ncbi:uncharacterized protein LOC118265072 [Spodoptera frugiperda]|uniref:Uncharacterized protein LOC118265072 n=1 Tax=Spodoptera frugiperda TaxID=7108 RepID=A0A9R0CYF8_SPOFR|nr:uncharacterized protein LOC118265072 [Spodoptera frugiperda]
MFTHYHFGAADTHFEDNGNHRRNNNWKYDLLCDNELLRIDPSHDKFVNQVEISVLAKGLDFVITPNRIPYENIICCIEEAIKQNKIPIYYAEAIRHDVATILCESKLPPSNITKKERLALKAIQNNEDIIVLQSYKENVIVVINKSDYINQIKHLLNNEKLYKPMSYNTKAQTHHLQTVSDGTNGEFEKLYKPAPQKPPVLYGSPIMREDKVLLQPIVRQINSPNYNLARHMAQVLQPLVEQSANFVKDSRHFVEIIKDIKLEPNDIMVNLNVQALFSNISIMECLNIVQNKLESNRMSSNYMQLLRNLLTGNCFLFQDKCYLQIDGLTMGNPVTPILANLWMEYFEAKVLRQDPNIIKVWKRNVDEIFCIFTGSQQDIERYIMNLNSINANMKFTYKMETDRTLAFLGIELSVRADGTLSHGVYWKSTAAGRFPNATSHHHPRLLQSKITSLKTRLHDLCDSEHLEQELDNLYKVLPKNGYQMNGRFKQLKKCGQPQGKRQPIYLPYIQGVTDKIGSLLVRKYSIPTIYQRGTTIKQLVSKPKNDLRLQKPGIYKIKCSCGMYYIGRTGRPIATRFKEHKVALKNKEIKKSAIAEHVLDSGPGHSIEDRVEVISNDPCDHSRIVRETIEIRKHNPFTFNRVVGFKLSGKWDRVIEKISLKKIKNMDTNSLEYKGTQPVRQRRALESLENKLF